MSTTPSPPTDEYWVPTSDGHELHVRCARPPAQTEDAAAVLLLPGLFSDGGLFLSRSGGGPAAVLAAAGFVTHSASLRGHGSSRWPRRRAYDWNFDTYVRHDIPDLVRAVGERHAGPLFVLAHSMAGYAALAALGVDPAVQERLSGVVTLSAAVNDYTDGGPSKRLQVGGAALLARVAGRFPARALRQGRWDEPAGLMRQFAQWAPGGAFRSADGRTDYWSALGQVTVPALVGVGAADRFHASPARARKLADHLGGPVDYLVLGRDTGLSWDAGHFDVLRGGPAEAEVLPRIIGWMRRQGD
ncbi:alpha/beta fold hydrolase [Solwaraspora sp. WMMB335]|uniref:alpha/beta fold hydrolase n=1 Tax=Solwaraspora sp. WMMB335 TaxID=3404118 RepID=UPI003B95C504